MERPRAVLLVLRARPRRAVAMVAALVVVGAGEALGVRAWVVDDGGDATPRTLAEFRPAVMTVYDSESGSRTATDPAGIERAAPFPILLPAYVPRGYELQTVQVSLGPAGISARAAEVGASVIMVFAPDPRAPGLMLDQRGGVVQFEPTAGVTVNGAPAHTEEVGPAQSRGRLLQWSLCNRGMSLVAGVSSVTVDELVRVAESVRGEC